MPPNLRTSYPRYSIEEARELGHRYYYCQDTADDVLLFFSEFLRHTKGRFANQKFEPLPWQIDLLEAMFGHLRVEDHLRRFRTVYISTAKKNGKSSLLAGLALFLTLADGEEGAECYSVATDVSQASIVFREASLMVQASPLLAERLEINRSRRNISDHETSSFYRVLPGEGFRTEGINAHAICFDELHAQRGRALYDALRFAGSSRDQPFFIATTTAGVDRNSICYEMYQHAIAVGLDPAYDETFLPCVWEASEQDDWKSVDSWKAANPSWGVTIKPEAFEADFKEAEKALTKENAFRRYRVNQWTQQLDRFLSMDQWSKGSVPPPEPLEGRPCWVGLDLASTYDISAMVAVFPDSQGSFDVLCKFWVPADTLPEREKRDHLPYSAWVKEAENGLTTTPGNVTDYDFVRRDINDFAKKYQIKKILVDRWNATQLAIQLSSDGLEVLGFSQGFSSMSGATKMLEHLVVSQKLRHGGNKVLSAMAGAVAVKTDPSGNIRPVKPAKGAGMRIDGIVALIMAIGGHAKEEIVQKPLPDIIII